MVSNGLQVATANWPTWPALRELRERVVSGSVGAIYQLSCMQWDAEPPTAEFSASSGGIAIDMGVHELDQLRKLVCAGRLVTLRGYSWAP